MNSALSLNYLTHLFYPNKSNNYKARVLHSSHLMLLILFVLTFQLVINIVSYPKIAVLGYAANISPEEVVRLTNERRAENGLGNLSYSPILAQAALAKGTHMLNNNYWAHVSPDGTEPWYFFNSVGYDYKYAGENLARDFSNPKEAVEAWMASPSHRENMLSDNYSEIGIAVVEGDINGVDTTIIVQLFGTRASVAAAKEISVVAAKEEEAMVEANEERAVSELELGESVSGQYLGFTGKHEFLASPFSITKYSNLMLMGLMLLVITLDAFVVYRKNVVRSGGRVFAHMSFLGMIFLIILIIQAGKIM